MAPFSPNKDESPLEARRRLAEGDAETPFRSYKENVLTTTNPDLVADIDNILNALEETENKRTTGKKSQRGDSTQESTEISETGRYEQQRPINKVSLEIPLMFGVASSAGDNENCVSLPKLQLSRNARFAVHCHVPPSTPKGKWTASMSGTTKIHQLIGSSNGSMELSYKFAPRARLVGGFDMISLANTRPLQLRLGAYLTESNSSSIQIMAKQQKHNTWGFSMTTKDVMDPWILSSSCFWHPSTRQWNCMASVSSMTTHVIRLGCGLSSAAVSTGSTMSPSSNPNCWKQLPTISVGLDSKVSDHRRFPLNLQYHPFNGAWSASATIQTTQSNRKKGRHARASWTTGIQRQFTGKTYKFAINIVWQKGDLSVRIPVLLGTLAWSQKSTPNESSSTDILEMATPYLIAIVIGMAQEMVSRFVWGASDLTPSTLLNRKTKNVAGNKSINVKLRGDAATQQTLMQRQAQKSKDVEANKNGLVIHKGTYALTGETWDVTIPLQFWVVNETSSLMLTAGSKQHLLGFYPLTTTSARPMEAQTQTFMQQAKSAIPWWQEYWTPTKQRNSTSNTNDNRNAKQEPTLSIHYSFQGKEYHIKISDKDALQLPQAPSEQAAL